MGKEKRVLCPIGSNKIRIKARPNTLPENFPLVCPKCKQKTVISLTGQNALVTKMEDRP